MNHFARNMKLQNKLTLTYLIACIVPLLISSLIIYNFSIKSLEETSLEFASIYNSQVVTNIDNFIDEYDNITKSILIDSDFIASISSNENTTMNERVNNQIEVQRILMRLYVLKPEIINVLLVTQNDTLYQYGRMSDIANIQKLKQQDWFQQMLSSEERMAITAIHDTTYYETAADDVVLTIGRVIMNMRGEQLGVLLFDVHPQHLLELNQDFLVARNQYNMKLTVSDQRGGILYDSDVLSGQTTWEQALEQGYTPLEDKKNADYLLMSNETNRGGLIVTTEIPRASLLFKIGRINYVTWIAVGACIWLTVLASFLISRTITRPIKELEVKMKEAEDGQYITIDSAVGSDEVGSLVTSYNQMISRIRALIEDVYIAEIKQKNARFLALQMQINPHMLFNTLESIRMKAVDNEEVARMIKALSRMFRIVLGKEKKRHTIHDEIDYVKNYLELQNIRYANRFYLEMQLDTSILDCSIISMVFQPIIENSIHHGFQDYATPLHIRIEGKKTNTSDILFRFTDDGAGISTQQAKKINTVLAVLGKEVREPNSDGNEDENSIGLKNIAERIKLQYGDEYYLTVNALDGQGTLVEILIPRR